MDAELFSVRSFLSRPRIFRHLLLHTVKYMLSSTPIDSRVSARKSTYTNIFFFFLGSEPSICFFRFYISHLRKIQLVVLWAICIEWDPLTLGGDLTHCPQWVEDVFQGLLLIIVTWISSRGSNTKRSTITSTDRPNTNSNSYIKYP